jgi:hypothetical protein
MGVFSACKGGQGHGDAHCEPAPFFDQNMDFVSQHRFTGESDRSEEFLSLEQGIDLIVRQTCGPPRRTVFEITVFDNFENVPINYPEEAAYYFYQIAGIAPGKLADLELWSKEIGERTDKLQDGQTADILGYAVRVDGSQSAESLRLTVEMTERK